METITSIPHARSASKPEPTKGVKTLIATGKVWFVAAVLGQWIFAAYIAAFYMGSALMGNYEAWGEVLPHPIEPGDPVGNIALAGHLFLAVIIFVCGPMQFVPLLRIKTPRFHRWNGVTYLITAMLTSVFGLYLTVTRGTTGGFIMELGTSLDGVLILTFSILAWRLAIKRKFLEHERWMMRLFIVVGGVWFFRVGLMFWIMINGGPAGFDPETFTGPFLSFWTFGQFALPLLILELYFLAKDRAGRLGRLAASALIVVATLAMCTGVVVASMYMWLPRI